MNCTFVVRLVGCAVCSAAILLTAGCREETSADAPPMPVPVQTCRVKQITMHPVLDLVGTIVAIPERSASVSPQTGGWIKELAVTEGHPIEEAFGKVVLIGELPGGAAVARAIQL